jgi:hypothetical protein
VSALACSFDVDYGKSAELSPIRTVEPVAKTDEAASKERESMSPFTSPPVALCSSYFGVLCTYI